MKRYITREVGWLSFSERILQEAADERVPLIERLMFLGLYSSTMDEFFRVRVAALKRYVSEGNGAEALFGARPRSVLHQIQRLVVGKQYRFDDIYADIITKLESHGIFLVDEDQLDGPGREYVARYFATVVRPTLFPVMLGRGRALPTIKDHALYLAVRLSTGSGRRKYDHALIEVPTDSLSRFIVLPGTDDMTRIILLDDVIRAGLATVFSFFGYDHFEAYAFKLTRDAELDFGEDITKSLLEKVSRSLRQRREGKPVRFVYDAAMPDDLLKLIIRRNRLTATDTLVPGGRYHNFKDFMHFPSVGPASLKYGPFEPVRHPLIRSNTSIMDVVRTRDVLLHHPYHSFGRFIDFLREASIDPRVESITMTLYRLAPDSSVIDSLINAARNGKTVSAVIEFKARFDEAANINWAHRLEDAGVRIIHGVPDLKVHAKACLVTRNERGRRIRFAVLSTGNFNEVTAEAYVDHTLFTADTRITRDVAALFAFFEANYRTGTYRHLLVSPFTFRDTIERGIRAEENAAKKGREAHITIMVNNLVDKRIIDALYRAARAGVRIDLIIRGVSSLVPSAAGSEGVIRAISIVDRFLEHSRLFVFNNDGAPRYYLSSGDWMSTNFDSRVEIAFPILDPTLKEELAQFLCLRMADTTKARIIDAEGLNEYRTDPEGRAVRSQTAFHEYLASRAHQD